MPTSKATSSSTTVPAKAARRTSAKRSASATTERQDIRVLKREIAATVKDLRSIEGEVAKVVRRMVSETLDAAIAKVSNQEAVLIARDVGGLALEAVQQVLRGTAEGIEEVMKSYRATGKAAARRTATRKNASRAASRAHAA
jgi:uncharacterized FlaG/YvyC family protein